MTRWVPLRLIAVRKPANGNDNRRRRRSIVTTATARTDGEMHTGTNTAERATKRHRESTTKATSTTTCTRRRRPHTVAVVARPCGYAAIFGLESLAARQVASASSPAHPPFPRTHCLVRVGHAWTWHATCDMFSFCVCDRLATVDATKRKRWCWPSLTRPRNSALCG